VRGEGGLAGSVRGAEAAERGRQVGHRQRIDQPLRQRAGLDPNPAEAHAERGQDGDNISRIGQPIRC